MKNLLLIISVCFTSLLFAQDRVARVLKVTSSKKYALIKHLSSYDASVGNTLNIETSDGGSCQVKILKSMGNNRVIVGLKDCSVRNSVQRGDWISKSAIVVQDEFEEFEEEEQQPQRKMEKKKEAKSNPMAGHNVFVLYNMASELAWDGTTDTGAEYKLTESSAGALGLGYEYFKFNSGGNWGWSIGGAYELSREISTYTIESGGTTTEVTPTTPPVYTFLNFHLNANYTFGPKLYGIGGLVLSMAGAAENLVEIGTGFGGQAGAGYNMGKYKFELLYRMVQFSGTATSGTSTIDLSTKLSGLILSGGYSF